MCESSESETVEHVLLFCQNYRIHRKQLFSSLSKCISLVTLVNDKYVCEMLLYGDPKYNWLTNKEIIKATIQFILTSKRFDTALIETLWLSNVDGVYIYGAWLV